MKKIGYLITGLALGLTLSVASPVLAQSVKSITAKLNNTVNVLVNGEKVNLNAQPITYNNLNYLPVGEIGRALGLNISWNGHTNTIEITDTTDSQYVQIVKVYDYDDVSLAFKNWNIEESKKANIKVSIQKDKILLGLYDKIYYPKPYINYYYDQKTDKGYFEESYLKSLISEDVIKLLSPINISVKNDKVTLLQ